jgi:hypothetical protein
MQCIFVIGNAEAMLYGDVCVTQCRCVIVDVACFRICLSVCHAVVTPCSRVVCDVVCSCAYLYPAGGVELRTLALS